MVAIINTSSLNSVPYLQSFLSAIIGFYKKRAPLFGDNSDCGHAPGRKEEFMGDEEDVRND
jgi:hypothetical protein